MHARFHTSSLATGLALLLPLAASAVPLDSGPLRSAHLTSQLVAQSTAAVAGQPLRLGLRLTHDPHWHTYWRNPGDSGLATKIEFELPAGVTAGDIEWPAPQRFDVEGIVNFGYADTVLLPITLHIPANFSDSSIVIAAKASWLICEIECIPGSGSYHLSVPIATGSAAGVVATDPRWIADFERASTRQPLPLDANAAVSHVEHQVLIDIQSAKLPPDIAAWEVFPLAAQVIVNGAYPMWSKLDGGMRMRLPISDAFGGLPARFDFLLVKDDQSLLVNAHVTPSP